MTGKNTAVFGIYSGRQAAEEAVDRLRDSGFRSTDISALFPENQGTKDFAHEKNTKAPEGTTTGVISGGIAGGVLGWLTGIGALAIPGLGPFIAAGPIVAALAGAGAMGTVGGIIGALVGMDIPEYEAKRFEGRIREGGILLSVHCDSTDWVARAKGILRNSGAQDIAAAGEKTGDFANADKPMPRVRGAGSGGVLTDDVLYGDRADVPAVTRIAEVDPLDRTLYVRAAGSGGVLTDDVLNGQPADVPVVTRPIEGVPPDRTPRRANLDLDEV